jgi:transposase
MSEHTYDSHKSTQISGGGVVVKTERRRRWSDADKQRILQETLEPGATVARVAKRHRIGTGAICTWRHQALAGALGGFLPVTVAENLDASPELTTRPEELERRSADRHGIIEINLSNGTRLRVDNTVDGAALRRVLAALEGR